MQRGRMVYPSLRSAGRVGSLMRENPLSDTLMKLVFVGGGIFGLWWLLKPQAAQAAQLAASDPALPVDTDPKWKASSKPVSDNAAATVRGDKSWNQMDRAERGQECLDRLAVLHEGYDAWTPAMKDSVDKKGFTKYKDDLYGCIRYNLGEAVRDEAYARFGAATKGAAFKCWVTRDKPITDPAHREWLAARGYPTSRFSKSMLGSQTADTFTANCGDASVWESKYPDYFSGRKRTT